MNRRAKPSEDYLNVHKVTCYAIHLGECNIRVYAHDTRFWKGLSLFARGPVPALEAKA